MHYMLMKYSTSHQPYPWDSPLTPRKYTQTHVIRRRRLSSPPSGQNPFDLGRRRSRHRPTLSAGLRRDVAVSTNQRCRSSQFFGYLWQKRSELTARQLAITTIYTVVLVQVRAYLAIDATPHRLCGTRSETNNDGLANARAADRPDTNRVAKKKNDTNRKNKTELVVTWATSAG